MPFSLAEYLAPYLAGYGPASADVPTGENPATPGQVLTAVGDIVPRLPRATAPWDPAETAFMAPEDRPPKTTLGALARAPWAIGDALAGGAQAIGEDIKRMTEASAQQEYDPAATFRTTMNLATLGAPFAIEGGAGIFGGKLGAQRLAEAGEPKYLNAWMKAEEMKAANQTPEAILAVTTKMGAPISTAKEGGFRYEMPDIGTHFTPEGEALIKSGGSGKFQDVYRHPELVTAYPEVGNLDVHFRDPMPGMRGFVSRGGLNAPGREMYLNPDAPQAIERSYGRPELTPGQVLESIRSTGLHEPMHAIQSVEKFPAGGSLSSPEVVQAARKATQARAKDLDRQIQDLRDSSVQWIERQRTSGDLFGGGDVSAATNEFYAQHPDYIEKLGKLKSERWQLGQRGGRAQTEAKYKAYHDLAGETEARNVQARADMTPEELAANPPVTTEDVPRGEQLLRFGDPAFALDTAPTFQERMAAGKDTEFTRAQRGAATGDYGLGTGVRTAPQAPTGSFDRLAAEQRQGFKNDTAAAIERYRAATGQPDPGRPQPLLAPGETDLQFSTQPISKEAQARIRQLQYDRSLARSRGENVEGEAYAPIRNEIKRLREGGALLAPGEKDLQFSSERIKPPGMRPEEPYDFLTGTRPDAPFPQFAERYPETGPPTMVPRDKGPGLRPEKTLTPEGEAVKAARGKIVEEMRSEGYQPFFDPSQRTSAEFEKQPGPHVDTTAAVAKKQETIDRHMQTIGAPETLARLREAYSKGLDLPDSQAWYLMGQVEKKMVQDMGEEAGRKHFRDTMATAMASTTTGMNPQQNLIMAQYLNYLRKTGQPLPTESFQTPVAVGGQRTMPNVEAYSKVFSDPRGPYEALGLQNPKRTDFAQALMGNPKAFTIDEQMASGMLGVDVPQGGTYGLVTKVGREEAARAGVDPQRYQDVAWAGFKKQLEEEGRAKKGFRPYGEGEGYQGKPFIAEVNDMIERMHRLTGMPRQEIWERGFLKNEIPAYSVGGLTLGGVLESQMNPTTPTQ